LWDGAPQAVNRGPRAGPKAGRGWLRLHTGGARPQWHGYPDLAVGAPGSPTQRKGWDLGSINIIFGGRNGLRATNTTLIPAATDEPGFAGQPAAGDVNGDGTVDLIEGAPDADDVGDGHLSFALMDPTVRAQRVPVNQRGEALPAGTLHRRTRRAHTRCSSQPAGDAPSSRVGSVQPQRAYDDGLEA
jgi:hypothetical protein